MNRRLFILFFLLVPGVLAAPSAGAALRVVATTPDFAAVAQAVGGERVRVRYLAKPTEDPHYVDAKPSHIVTLNRADVLIDSGTDLEIGWLPTLVQGARNPKIVLGAPGRIHASDGIQLLDVPAVLDRSQGDVHARGNPHFMMDPENAVVVARNFQRRFCALDPQGCGDYAQGAAGFEQAVRQGLERWTPRLAAFRGTAIVTYHNTWRYFARRFGLEAELFLEPKPGIPPSPPHLAKVIQTMRQRGIRVVLVEPYQNRKTAEAVAGHAGGVVVEVCQFPGGLPGTDGDYVALMDAVVERVARALEQTSGP